MSRSKRTQTPRRRTASGSSKGGGDTHEVTIARSELYRGPIPPPQVLLGYNEIIPGLADRIVLMAEKEQAHHHLFSTNALKARVVEARLGQIFGLIIAVLGFLVAGYFASLGQPWAGVAIVGVHTVAIVTVFIKGRQ